MHLKSVFYSTRPTFLILTVVCIFLGGASAHYSQADINPLLVALISIAALAAHISVNLLNEYLDFSSGLDLHTTKTPFSGGSGSLPAAPAAAPLVLVAGLLALTVTMVAGLVLVKLVSWRLFIPGLIGISLIVAYTPFINRLPILCLLAPGIGFGLLMVLGTHYTLAKGLAVSSWFIAMVPFCQINNLLLLNQLPDVEPDRAAGRQTFPIVYGMQTSLRVYLLFTLLSVACIGLGVWLGQLPTISLAALFTALLALIARYKVHKSNSGLQPLTVGLAINVACTTLTPAVLAISLLL